MEDSSENLAEIEQPKIPASFEKRWDIPVDLKDAKKCFINRIFNGIDIEFNDLAMGHSYSTTYQYEIKFVASKMGMRYEGADNLEYYAGKDFYRILKCIEAFYEALEHFGRYGGDVNKLDQIVKSAIIESEFDLGIEWRDGVFYPSGAKLLDEELINQPLKWLEDQKYASVFEPFQKGLRHHMEATKDPSKLSDTITDIYEAVEAMAKVVCENDRELSENRELFISKLQLSDRYKKLLKEYISYGCDYRHAVKPSETRVFPRPNEVEAFIYMSGLFIRLAIRQQNAT